MQEQDEKASIVLQMGLAKEEHEFERRLKRYIAIKEEAKTKPLEDVLNHFTATNEAKLNEAIKTLTSQVRVHVLRDFCTGIENFDAAVKFFVRHLCRMEICVRSQLKCVCAIEYFGEGWHQTKICSRSQLKCV